MQIIENMEDLLTFDLEDTTSEVSEELEEAEVAETVELKEVAEKEKPIVAYTEFQKLGFSLMMEGSKDPYDIAKLKNILATPTRFENSKPTIRYTIIDAQKKAEIEEVKFEKYNVQKAKFEKIRLNNLRSQAVEAEEVAAKKLAEKELVAKKELKEIIEIQNEIDMSVAEVTEAAKPLTLEKNKTNRMKNAKAVVDPDYVRITPNTTAENVNKRVRKTKIEQLQIAAINDLYIMTRFKYVKQYVKKGEEATYTFMPYMLSDTTLTKHLRKQSTIGIFSGKELTKFICFDVDSKDLDYSKQLAQEVIEVLSNTFNIDKQYIHISFSGLKGYHVELIFEEAIENTKAKQLYIAVMSQINPLNGAEVEFRPTFKQAVKLPLSLNLKTNAVCYYVNTDSLDEITDPLYVTTLINKKLPKSCLQAIFNDEHLFTLENEKASKIEEVFAKVIDLQFTDEDKEKQVVELLTLRYLQRAGTRNNMTFKAAAFLNSQGQTQEDTVATLNAIMLNTWTNHRLMLSESDVLQEINEETARIVNNVFLNNWGLTTKNKEIKIYQSEMEAVISLPKGYLRNLLFSFIVHSKKYANADGSFFFAYISMTQMGNAADRASLINYIQILQNLGLVDRVSRAVLNKALTQELGMVRFDTNKYKVTLSKPLEDEPFIIHNTNKKNINMFKIAKKLVDEKTIKDSSSRRDWDNNYKKLYK